jgi:spermidine synthase
MEYGFPKMAEILKPEKKGVASLDYVTVTKEQASFGNMQALFSGAGGLMHVEPGKYARLAVNNQLMMTDTQMERRTNIDIKHRAHGDVLIGGLGIGMVILGICEKPEVKSVTVVEKYQDVIDVIEPQLRPNMNGASDKLKIVCADVFNWKSKQKFNVIYFDIWPTITTDNLPDMAKLHQKYKNALDRTDENCWMSSWMRDYLKSVHRRYRSAY